MAATAELAQACRDEDLGLIRELMSYDSLCPTSTTFVRDGLKQLQLLVPPSPLHWSRQMEWPWVLNNGDFKPTDTVLDVGAGWSCLKFALAKRAGAVVCLEPDVEFMRKGAASVGLILGWDQRKIAWLNGDVRDTGFNDNAFDKVVCCSVIEHIPDGHVRAIKECVRVLKPGGHLLLTMDVRLKGDEDYGDFHLDLAGAGEVFRELGCPPVECPVPTLGSRQMDGKVEIIVVMIKFTKEK